MRPMFRSMKKFVLLPLALLVAAGTALADDQLRNVQTELKNLGFYYGDATGQPSSETTSAIRRYQIRNGLEVTGSLNTETLAALGMGPAKKAPAPAPAVKPAPAAPAPPPPQVEEHKPPVNLRRNSTVEDEDRNFLRREEAQNPQPEPAPSAPSYRRIYPDDPSVVPPPAPLDAPAADFPVLFANTPYANAPLPVQQETLRRAQAALASRGFYRDVIDGLPGPATEEAILGYQRSRRMTMTGRLDLDTLAQLRLLPNTAGGFREPQQRTFRGIWINRDRGGLRFGIELN